MTQALNFGELTSRSDAQGEYCDAIFLWPISATEQHGRHLPNSTDATILDGLRRPVESRLKSERPFVWLPPLVFGSSEEHVGFPGTLSLTPTTLMSVIDDVCRSLRAGGGTNIVFLNGHGGNVGVLSVMLREVRLRHKMQTYLIRPMSQFGPPSHGGLDMHAGEHETSIMLAMRPDLVRRVPNSMEEAPRSAVQTYREVAGSMGWMTADLSSDGVIGDPRNASAEKGRKLIELMVKYVADEIHAFSRLLDHVAPPDAENEHLTVDKGGRRDIEGR